MGCFQCGSFGHWVESCRYPKGCYNCGQYDHFSPDCPWDFESRDFECEPSSYPDVKPAAVVSDSPARSSRRLARHRSAGPGAPENTASSSDISISPHSGKVLENKLRTLRLDPQDKPHVTQGETAGVAVDVIGEHADAHKNKGWQDAAAKLTSRWLKEWAQTSENLKEAPAIEGLTNSPIYQESMLPIEQVRSALEVRAQRHSLELNWRESIVDLLKLLDLASDIQARSRLARLLNVQNFLPGSPEGNMALHRAVIQELARGGGDLPRDMRNQLVGPGKSASMVGMDSEESEVGSVFSEDSTASSVSAFSQTANPAQEIAHLLRSNNALSPLLIIAYARYSTRRVTRKLKSLVSHYGRDLVSEASSNAQRIAAQFVGEAARQITTQLTRAMAQEAKSSIDSNRKELEKLLLAQSTQQQAANDPKDPLYDTEAEHSEQSESESELSLPVLKEVEQFMIESKAFTILVARIREWLGVLDEDVDENTPIEQVTRSPKSSDSINSAITEQTAYSRIAELSQPLTTLEALNKETNQSFLRRALSWVTLLEPMFWPRPPEGFKRITWKSPLGKPLYIDVKERENGAVERLQERFIVSAQERLSASSSSSFTSSTLGTVSSDTPAMTLRAPPAALVMNRSSSQFTVSHHANIAHSQPSPTVSATVPNNIRQASGKYLLVCFSTSKSERFEQIDVTHVGNDQALFEELHTLYNSIREDESWTSKIPLLSPGKMPPWLCWFLDHLHLYEPRKINFVSFSLMPLGRTPTPFNIKTPSIPPAREVHLQNWHYSPCPIEIEEWAISEAFAAKLLEPGHAFPNAEWLELFPKKLRSSFIYEPGKRSTLWGINIVEGLNKAALVRIALCVVLSSALLGLVYSLASHDVSAAFALAGWFATSAALFIPYFQFKK
ncbi:putative HC-toxin efflux carrier TOXA [Aspergillus lentulus]|nr:putative HC-toxin efflux carrier TOXA [Aspergillus lentulus]